MLYVPLFSKIKTKILMWERGVKKRSQHFPTRFCFKIDLGKALLGLSSQCRWDRLRSAVAVVGGLPGGGDHPEGKCHLPPVNGRGRGEKTQTMQSFSPHTPRQTPLLYLAGGHHRESCDKPSPALPSWSRCVGRKDVAVGTGDLQDKKKE